MYDPYGQHPAYNKAKSPDFKDRHVSIDQVTVNEPGFPSLRVDLKFGWWRAEYHERCPQHQDNDKLPSRHCSDNKCWTSEPVAMLQIHYTAGECDMMTTYQCSLLEDNYFEIGY